MGLKLATPVQKIKGVGARYCQAFEKSGISTVFDLLLHFPVLYIDFANPAPEPEAGKKGLYLMQVERWAMTQRNRFRKRFSILRVNVRIGDTPVLVVFFNKHYLEDFFKEHKTAYIYGEPEFKNDAWEISNPLLYTEEESQNQPVLPFYNKIATVKSGVIKRLVTTALSQLDDDFEPLPRVSLETHGFPGIADTLTNIHFPEQHTPREIDMLKKRFIYHEFLFFQLELQFIRNFFKQVPRVNTYTMTPRVKEAVKQSLPFQLTPDQKNSCRDITSDLQGETTMQRLLQGDVGSGKTIVAFIALLMAVESGYQGAFLAPTEILARQHFTNAAEFFKGSRIGLLTGSTPVKERKETLAALVSGEIDIVFGTHALLTESVTFKHLSMVVIDEQHRFGVSQRAALYYKGHAVDLLVTTATPIPRTMLLSLYNDLSVSTIKTKPAGRLPIISKIVPPERRDQFYTLMRKKLEEGEKAYIILPLIEKSEYFTELRDIETESAYFKKIFKEIPLGIVTGRTSAEEKDQVLAALASGEISVLIATTVIEVGIDVRDATMMVIENADRYGLSQLHQLRGRVGRGEKQSYCYLFPSPNITESGKKRLKTIAGTDDGFKIAETDLGMRGGGIIPGLEQSGRLDFRVGNLRDHHDIFQEARQDAIRILEDDSLQNETIGVMMVRLREKVKEINFS